jgi:hypothetical protein
MSNYRGRKRLSTIESFGEGYLDGSPRNRTSSNVECLPLKLIKSLLEEDEDEEHKVKLPSEKKKRFFHSFKR